MNVLPHRCLRSEEELWQESDQPRLRDLKHWLLRLHPGLFLWLETVAYLSLWNLQRPLPLPLFLWVSRGRPPHLFLCGVCICQHLSSHRRVCIRRSKVDGYLHSITFIYFEGCVQVSQCKWEGQRTTYRKSVLSFPCVSGDGAQFISLGWRTIWLVLHLCFLDRVSRWTGVSSIALDCLANKF